MAAEIPVELAAGEVKLSEGLRQFVMLPCLLLDDLRVTAGAVRMFAMLQGYAGRGDRAWPGQAKLAERMDVSARTVRTYIDELVEAGWLKVIRHGLRMTNSYLLLLPGEITGTADDGSDRKQASCQDGKRASGQGAVESAPEESSTSPPSDVSHLPPPPEVEHAREGPAADPARRGTAGTATAGNGGNGGTAEGGASDSGERRETAAAGTANDALTADQVRAARMLCGLRTSEHVEPLTADDPRVQRWIQEHDLATIAVVCERAEGNGARDPTAIAIRKLLNRNGELHELAGEISARRAQLERARNAAAGWEELCRELPRETAMFRTLNELANAGYQSAGETLRQINAGIGALDPRSRIREAVTRLRGREIDGVGRLVETPDERSAREAAFQQAAAAARTHAAVTAPAAAG